MSLTHQRTSQNPYEQSAVTDKWPCDINKVLYLLNLVYSLFNLAISS